MRCFYHEDREAVGTCQTCGKALCRECAGKFTPVTCDDCHRRIVAKSMNEREMKKQELIFESKSKLIKSVLLGSLFGILFIVVTTIGEARENPTIFYYIITFLAGFGIPFGWAAIGTFMPLYYGVSSRGAATAMILNGLRFVASIVIGFPIFVIQTILTIIKLSNAKKM
jgi:hypothetical protein